MGGKPLGLGWSLFGYRRSAVVRLIEDRDQLLSEAYKRVRASEERVAELEGEMGSLREQNARLEQHLELLRGQMVAIASRTQPLSHYLSSTPSIQEPPEPSMEPEQASVQAASGVSQAMVTELARVLSSAEEGAARIIHQAAVTAQEQVDRSARAWRELKAEAAKVDAWRQSMGPAITTVRARLGDVKTRIDEIPIRIQAALAPLADAMSSIQDGLAQLSSLFGALSSPAWGPADQEEEPGGSAEPDGPSPNGKVEPGVIRLPEATVGPADEADPQDAFAWMRATVGY